MIICRLNILCTDYHAVVESTLDFLGFSSSDSPAPLKMHSSALIFVALVLSSLTQAYSIRRDLKAGPAAADVPPSRAIQLNRRTTAFDSHLLAVRPRPRRSPSPIPALTPRHDPTSLSDITISPRTHDQLRKRANLNYIGGVEFHEDPHNTWEIGTNVGNKQHVVTVTANAPIMQIVARPNAVDYDWVLARSRPEAAAASITIPPIGPYYLTVLVSFASGNNSGQIVLWEEDPNAVPPPPGQLGGAGLPPGSPPPPPASWPRGG